MEFTESNPMINEDLAKQIKAEREASRQISPSEIQTHHERALMGLILLDPSALDRVEIELGGYAWIDDTCRQLWPVLVSMRRKGEPIADRRSVAIVAKPAGVSAEVKAALKNMAASFEKARRTTDNDDDTGRLLKTILNGK